MEGRSSAVVSWARMCLGWIRWYRRRARRIEDVLVCCLEWVWRDRVAGKRRACPRDRIGVFHRVILRMLEKASGKEIEVLTTHLLVPRQVNVTWEVIEIVQATARPFPPIHHRC